MAWRMEYVPIVTNQIQDAWYNKCDPGKFLKEGKTSENPEIDNLIYEALEYWSKMGELLTFKIMWPSEISTTFCSKKHFI